MTPSRAQGQLMPAFKEQDTWDKGVGERICSLPASRKGKRKYMFDRGSLEPGTTKECQWWDNNQTSFERM